MRSLRRRLSWGCALVMLCAAIMNNWRATGRQMSGGGFTGVGLKRYAFAMADLHKSFDVSVSALDIPVAWAGSW